jgi:hypothetical protein
MFPLLLVGEGQAVLIFLLLSLAIFVLFAALSIYIMRSAVRWGGVSWAFGVFPPGLVLWRKKPVETRLSELRSYEMWLKSELDWVRKEIEEMEKRNL